MANKYNTNKIKGGISHADDMQAVQNQVAKPVRGYDLGRSVFPPCGSCGVEFLINR